MQVRKYVTVVEEIYMDMIYKEEPSYKVAAAAVLKNPCAGEYVEDLEILMQAGEKLGDILTAKAIKALGVEGREIHSFGKAAIVGEKGELEHAAAILHPRLGAPLRAQIAGGKAVIPSAKKMGGMGTAIDVPLHYKDAMKVRSHYDAMEVRIGDAPRADEIVVVVAFTLGGRPFARVPGLRLEEIKGIDGLV